jgi:hypothetical protein
MHQLEEDRLKCPEQFESPPKKVNLASRPLISLDISNKKFPYFCCNIHEEDFQGEFQSEEEAMAMNEEFEEILFLNQFNEDQVHHMKLKDEISVQCNDGTPVSLKYLSSLPIKCDGARVLKPSRSALVTLHEPLVILPRTPCLVEEEEDDGTFQCRHCFKIFLTGQALGGHMSRKHPK